MSDIWRSGGRGVMRLVFSLGIAAFLSSCSPHVTPGQIEDDEEKKPSPPSQSDLAAITAPGYKSVAGQRQECFGRLVFNVEENVGWPIFYKSYDYRFTRVFSESVLDKGDEMRFGNTMVGVIGGVGRGGENTIFDDTPSGMRKYLLERIAEGRSYIERRKKEGGSEEQVQKDIEEEQGWIQQRGETLKRYDDENRPYDPGFPITEGYARTVYDGVNSTDSILSAFLQRGDYVYMFESTVSINSPADIARHKKDFAVTLAKFRPRAAGEIPTEPGVCIPFGFIADDGRTPIDFKQSLRYADAPGVLYTIDTGTVRSRGMTVPVIAALGRARIRPELAGEDGAHAVVTQRIGPRIVPMGGMSAMQGGTVVKESPPGATPYDIYSVFTGKSGWLGSAVLPYIMVDMRSITKDLAPELPSNPPPFKSSMTRLEQILTSLRWRPTTPPMREFVEGDKH